MYDLGADPFARPGTPGAAGFGAGFPFSDIMDAFFGAGAASRGPRSRARRGRNATVRGDLDLSECAFGATRDLAVDTAVVCPPCSGEGTAPGTHPPTCGVCGGPAAAAVGAALSVETLDGTRELDIRPGTQSGQIIPLYGLGVRHLNSSGRGDLIIHVTVETPTKLDEEQEALLRQLAKLRAEETPPGRC